MGDIIRHLRYFQTIVKESEYQDLAEFLKDLSLAAYTINKKETTAVMDYIREKYKDKKLIFEFEAAGLEKPVVSEEEFNKIINAFYSILKNFIDSSVKQLNANYKTSYILNSYWDELIENFKNELKRIIGSERVYLFNTLIQYATSLGTGAPFFKEIENYLDEKDPKKRKEIYEELLNRENIENELSRYFEIAKK